METVVWQFCLINSKPSIYHSSLMDGVWMVCCLLSKSRPSFSMKYGLNKLTKTHIFLYVSFFLEKTAAPAINQQKIKGYHLCEHIPVYESKKKKKKNGWWMVLAKPEASKYWLLLPEAKHYGCCIAFVASQLWSHYCPVTIYATSEGVPDSLQCSSEWLVSPSRQKPLHQRWHRRRNQKRFLHKVSSFQAVATSTAHIIWRFLSFSSDVSLTWQ